jgi:antitoxin component of MazEF toxin-antitoxin module
MAEAGMAPGQVVEVRVEDGRIVITPVPPPLYDLDALLSGVTEENRHGEIGFGPPRSGVRSGERARPFPAGARALTPRRGGPSPCRSTVSAMFSA